VSKNAQAIRAIQDALNCCGLRSTVDRAWPFRDARHEVTACQEAFGRARSCFEGWRGAERRVAGVILGVVVVNWAWEVSILREK
jgi:hypothetical protein